MMHEEKDPILERELNDGLRGLTYLRAGKAFRAADSTNDVLLALEKEGAPSGLIVMAARQLKGRGRLQRTWFTDEGDIAMSLLLRPPLVPKNWALISLMPAVALVTALNSLGVAAKLKWPNDIIVPKKPDENALAYFEDFRKVGGILVDNVFAGNELGATVVGMGLNIVPNAAIQANVPHAAFLGDYSRDVHRADYIVAILKALDNLIGDMAKPDFKERLLKTYSEHCESLNRNVRASMPDGDICGRAIALDSNGALIIDDGKHEHVIRAGDVVFAK